MIQFWSGSVKLISVLTDNNTGISKTQNLQAINAGEGVEKREPSYTVGGNAN